MLQRPLTAILKRLANLRRDTSAVAMIEMGFALPALIFTSFAGLETANLMITHTRISSVALSVADNASRIAAGSALAQPQVREADINDVFLGAQNQSGDLDIRANGRIIISSLETNITGGQWIHWQRCYGNQPYASSYGAQGTGLVGNTFPGMGPAGREVTASDGAPVMFVEVYYDYRPFMFGAWIGDNLISYNAAFGVRDARDTSNIFNPSPAALVASCPAGSGKTKRTKAPRGNAYGWWGW